FYVGQAGRERPQGAGPGLRTPPRPVHGTFRCFMGVIMKKVLLAGAALGLVFSSPALADIVIATAGPMAGQYASFGAQMKAGAEMAVADINAAGGVLGEQLKLEIGDDACDPKQAVAVANQFAGSGVQLVAGHFCSGSSIPASAVYAEEGIIQI